MINGDYGCTLAKVVLILTFSVSFSFWTSQSDISISRVHLEDGWRDYVSKCRPFFCHFDLVHGMITHTMALFIFLMAKTRLLLLNVATRSCK